MSAKLSLTDTISSERSVFMQKLWYKQEAKVYEEALPLGNGRIGAMVYGGPISDKISLNEETLWAGYPKRCEYSNSMEDVKIIRELVKDKRYYDATQKVRSIMHGDFAMPYVPYGDLYIDIISQGSQVLDYTRELNISDGIFTSSYKLNGVAIKKEAFVSLKDDVFVVNIKSDKNIKVHAHQSVVLENSAKMIDGSVQIKGRCPTFISKYTNTVEYDKNKESVHFCSHAAFVSDGQVYGGGNSLWAEGANITLLFSIKTSFNGYNKMPVSEGKEYINESINTLNKAKSYTYDELKKRHIDFYKSQFDRVSLEIDGEEYSSIPTDERLKNVKNGVNDNGFITLLFDYARYLIISSSQKDTEASNLQGIWNDKLIPQWHSNYTINMNTEMNYWGVETVNLPECHFPVFKMLKDFSEIGNEFGLRGWATWHTTDMWRFNRESYINPHWGYWKMGGFWLLRDIWEHYLHTKDTEFLKEYYPVMLGACEFLEDWMYENNEGFLTTCPSTSPENEFIHDGKSCSVCEGCAMDMEIIYDVFDKTIKTGEILGFDTGHYKNILSKLKPVKIGKDGRILEWGEELEELEIGHRHMAHLYFMYPGDMLDSKEYWDAGKKSLITRLSAQNRDDSCGWADIWSATMFARLKDGDSALGYIKNKFIKNNLLDNLINQACNIIQVDGSMGILAPILEMLIQSHKGKIELLPALPKEWKSGRAKGFITRTGEKISFEWDENGVKIL